MPLALILSSYVAASRVGGGGQLLALAQFGVDPVLVPSVLFGRHPGKGAPGGAPVAAEVFASALAAALDDVARACADAVLTGYFASAEQVAAAAAAIDDLRAAPRDGSLTGRLAVVVDPIMGDADTGLYVRPEVAEALPALVRRADWITPNLWELGRLTGGRADTPAAAAALARTLGPGVLVTSVPTTRGEIGLVLAPREEPAWLLAHARVPRVLRGAGDLLAAAFTAGLIEGLHPLAAARLAAGAAAEAAEAAERWDAPELPLVALGGRLAKPASVVRVERLA